MIFKILLLGAVLTGLCGCLTTPEGGAVGSVPAASGPVDAATLKIGQRIWKNECGGTVAGLTSWNAGENFASLGIGHCIWYPKGVNGPYEESFPALVAFLRASGVAVPAWLGNADDCPWNSRAEFQAAQQSTQMKELRTMLANSVGQQTRFLERRFVRALTTVINAAPEAERATIAARIAALQRVPAGRYALMDYVNFKGEGTNPKERYNGEGWGLLQVLQAMQGLPSGQNAAREFSAAAKRVLDRRIQLAPKNETQWRAGWFSRCDSYAQPF